MRFHQVDATVAQNYEAGGWATEGTKTNPTVEQVLADTGQLAAGIYDFDVSFDSSVTAAIYVHHRNAADSESLAYKRLYVPDHTFVCWSIRGLKIATNERLKLLVAADYTGSLDASIIYVKRV